MFGEALKLHLSHIIRRLMVTVKKELIRTPAKLPITTRCDDGSVLGRCYCFVEAHAY